MVDGEVKSNAYPFPIKSIANHDVYCHNRKFYANVNGILHITMLPRPL